MADTIATSFNSPIHARNVVAGVNISTGGTFNANFYTSPLSLEEECLKDLRLTDPRDDKKRIQHAKGGLLKDSYAWIFDHPDFKRWRYNRQYRLLWIRGDPGKGKTMSLCGIIDDMEKLGVYRLAYFFCQASDPRLRSAAAVLRGLIYSLLAQQPLLIRYVKEKYSHAGKSVFEDGNSLPALSEMLITILNDPQLGNVVLFVDALDECTEDLSRLLDAITQATASSPAKWIVTSRNLLSIEERLDSGGLDGTAKTLSICLELNQSSISTAVRSYIQHKIRLLASQKKYDAETRNTVEQYLVDNANDTFLWVALVYEELADKKVRKRHALAILKSFTPGLDALYQQMLKDICSSIDADICKQILAIVSVAYRPITLVELRHLIGSLESYDDEDLGEIISICGSYLTLREGTIHLVHQSVKDFLVTKGLDTIFPSGVEHIHRMIFSQSLRGIYSVLKRDIYNLYDPGFHIDNIKAPNSAPLAPIAYSCLYWADHLSDASHGDVMETEEAISDMDTVYSFLKDKCLYWLEALSLLRDVSRGVIALEKLKSLFDKARSSQLKDLLRDAHRFILSHRNMIEVAPLQLHVSALLFSPTSSLMRSLFQKEEAKWVTIKPSMETDWNACLQTLEGHTQYVRSIAFSSDNRIVSGSSDQTIKIWDATTSSCVRSLSGHSHWVTSVAFSANGRRIASGSRDGSIRILDSATGNCTQTLQENNEMITSVALSRDDKWVASGSSDDMIRIWNISKGICLHKLGGHRSLVTSIDFSNDGQRLVSGSYDSAVKIWDTGSGACLFTLGGHESFVTTVVFSVDGQRVASGADDKTIKIWDLSLGTCIKTLKGHTGMISSLSFSPDGRRLVSGAYDKKIKIWEEDTCIQTLEGHSDFISSVAFSADGQRVASGSHDKSIKIWDISAGNSPQTPQENHKAAVTATVFSEDRSRLGTGSWDNTVKIWDTATGGCLQTLEGHGHLVTSIAFSADEKIASGSYDNTIKIWSSGVCIKTLEGHTSFVTSVAFSANTSRKNLASGSDDRTIKIWDVSAGACIQTLKGHVEGVRSVAFSSVVDSLRIASGSDDKTVRVWDVTTGACLRTLNVNWRITQLSFDSTTRTRLYTNIGVLDLDLVPVNTPSSAIVPLQPIGRHDHSSYSIYSVGGSGRWIQKHGRPIVWLPPSHKSSISVAAGSMIAVGCDTGQVLMMQFSE